MIFVKQYYHYLLYTLVFVLTGYSKIVPPFIILLFVAGILYKPDFSLLWKNKVITLMLFLYAMVLIGYFYTLDSKQASFELVAKLSLFIFPLCLLPIIDFDETKINRLLKIFVVGCLVGLLSCVLIAVYNFVYEKRLIANNLYNLNYGFNFFLSSRFSFFLHPSYLAMYLCLAISIVLFKPHLFSKQFWRVIIVFVFFIGIMLAASKAGVLMLLTTILLYIISVRKIKVALLLTGVGGVLFGILYFAAPEFALKFTSAAKAFENSETDHNSTESSASRILVWQCSWDLIQQNPIVGYGTGSTNMVLTKLYQQRNYLGLLEKKLNAHNQFFQTWLANGLLALVALVSLLGMLFIQVLRARSWLGITLIFNILLNGMFESILENQAGVVFFSIWICYESLNCLRNSKLNA